MANTTSINNLQIKLCELKLEERRVKSDINKLVKNKQMIDFLLFNNLPFTILATKIDKLSKSKLNQNVESIAKELNLRKEMIILTSSLNKLGKDKVLDLIQYKLEEYEENAGD